MTAELTPRTSNEFTAELAMAELYLVGSIALHGNSITSTTFRGIVYT